MLKKIAMIDPNFTYVKYNNFPEHYTQKIFDISMDYMGDGYLDIDVPEKDEELILMMQLDKMAAYSINIEGIKFGVNVYISPPAKKMFDVHIDRSRKIGLNFPIQVDLEKGYTLVMKDDDYSVLGEPLPEVTKNIRFGDRSLEDKPGDKKWVDVDENVMEKVLMDKPILLNTGRPHSYVNYSNKFRIIASLNNSNEDLQTVYSALKPFL
jgi:hypothetical protein